MTTGLREFTGWARLKMLSGLQQNRQLVRMNDAMVAAELKKNFGDGIEVPKTEDDMLVGRDVVMPNPQPVVIMPPAAPQNNSGWFVALALGSFILMFVLLAIAFGIWYVATQWPKPTTVSAPPAVQASGEEWQVKFFQP